MTTDAQKTVDCDDPTCPGWIHMEDSMGRGLGIERCDTCKQHPNDDAANAAHARECPAGTACAYLLPPPNLIAAVPATPPPAQRRAVPRIDPTDLRCKGCGNTDLGALVLSRKVDVFSPIWGVVQGRLAFGRDEPYRDEYDHDDFRFQCLECGFEEKPAWLTYETVEHMGHLSDYQQAVAKEKAGDTHLECNCSEEELASTGIGWRGFPCGVPGHNPFEVSPEQRASPKLRGWFYVDLRVAVRCPLCDGSLLRKINRSLETSLRSIKNLEES